MWLVGVGGLALESGEGGAVEGAVWVGLSGGVFTASGWGGEDWITRDGV